MRILQLNAWTGRIKDGLSRFIAEGDYDIVCLQEAIWTDKAQNFTDHYLDSVEKIKQTANFQHSFCSSHYGISLFGGEAQLEQGIAILSKIPFTRTEEKELYGQYAVASHLATYNLSEDSDCKTRRYTAQKVQFENGLILVNYHGYYLTNPIGNETTVECMHKVAEMIKHEDAPIVMCGDLNVISESPAMRELDFLTDLTAKNQVKTTLRNIRFVKDVPCDHILVSDNVDYHNFQVIDAPVSDHCALSIEVDI